MAGIYHAPLTHAEVHGLTPDMILILDTLRENGETFVTRSQFEIVCVLPVYPWPDQNTGSMAGMAGLDAINQTEEKDSH